MDANTEASGEAGIVTSVEGAGEGGMEVAAAPHPLDDVGYILPRQV